MTRLLHIVALTLLPIFAVGAVQSDDTDHSS
jgi:hypothetical protein